MAQEEEEEEGEEEDENGQGRNRRTVNRAEYTDIEQGQHDPFANFLVRFLRLGCSCMLYCDWKFITG